MLDIFELHIPSFPLHDYINSMVYYDGYSLEHSIDRLIPDGTINVIIEFYDEPQYIFDNETLTKIHSYKKAWVSGMQTRYISISSGQRTSMFVMQFKASGAYPFLQLPISELNNRVVDAELVLGPSVMELREQIATSGTIADKFGIAEAWLMRRLLKKREDIPELVVTYAVDQTLTSPGSTSIHELTAKTGYSQKQLIQLYKKYVGLTPKQYQRIARFNKVLEQLQSQKLVSWAKLSSECGFYDQAHFIKEFKLFSGFSPRKFVTEKGDYIHYVPIK